MGRTRFRKLPPTPTTLKRKSRDWARQRNPRVPGVAERHVPRPRREIAAVPRLPRQASVSFFCDFFFAGAFVLPWLSFLASASVCSSLSFSAEPSWPCWLSRRRGLPGSGCGGFSASSSSGSSSMTISSTSIVSTGLFLPLFLFFVAGQFVVFLVVHLRVKHRSSVGLGVAGRLKTPSALINGVLELCQGAWFENFGCCTAVCGHRCRWAGRDRRGISYHA